MDENIGKVWWGVWLMVGCETGPTGKKLEGEVESETAEVDTKAGLTVERTGDGLTQVFAKPSDVMGDVQPEEETVDEVTASLTVGTEVGSEEEVTVAEVITKEEGGELTGGRTLDLKDSLDTDGARTDVEGKSLNGEDNDMLTGRGIVTGDTKLTGRGLLGLEDSVLTDNLDMSILEEDVSVSAGELVTSSELVTEDTGLQEVGIGNKFNC